MKPGHRDKNVPAGVKIPSINTLFTAKLDFSWTYYMIHIVTYCVNSNISENEQIPIISLTFTYYHGDSALIGQQKHNFGGFWYWTSQIWP